MTGEEDGDPPEVVDHGPQAQAGQGVTGDDPGRERRTVPAAAFVLAVMVAVTLGALAVAAVTFGDGFGDDGDDDDDRRIRLAAARFTETFLTFEHGALDEWKQDVLDLSTGGFANEVEEVESGLRRLISESDLDAATRVTDVFVGERERGAVDVVVIYDRDVRGSDGRRSETDRYLQLSMVHVEGEWLVDHVIDVVTAGGLPAPAPPTTGGDDGSGGG